MTGNGFSLAMLTTTPTPGIIQLRGIRWHTYEALQADLDRSDRGLRLTYYQGDLEIMAPSPEHELYKRTAGRLIETIAEELEIDYLPLGSTTLKQPERIGGEPDECFYIQNLAAIRGKKRIDLEVDPPPDLVVEIDITHSSQTRLAMYAELGVPEVWQYRPGEFKIYCLYQGSYLISDRSQIFPTFPVADLYQFLDRAFESSYPELIREFRSWVKRQIAS